MTARRPRGVPCARRGAGSLPALALALVRHPAMPTFLHAADLHLDSPLRGLHARDAEVGAQVRNATRQAFRALVDRAISDQVRFVVLAGDLFDDTHQSVDTALFLNSELKRLVDRAVGVFLLRGNHDHLARPSAVLLPKGVFQFGSAEATTETRPDLGVALHGQSFGEQRIDIDLTDGYPIPVPGLLNIGVLHTALEGRSGVHQRYAPTSAGKLGTRGYDYWALGHVHTRDVFREGQTHIAYPGNVQGRHINEAGPKGALLVDWEGTTITAVRPFETAVLRWQEVVVDVVAAEGQDDQLRYVAEAVADATREARGAGRIAAVRVRIRGAGAAIGQLSRDQLRGYLRQAVAMSCGENVLLEEVRLEALARVELPVSLHEPIERLAVRLLAPDARREDALFAREIWEKVNAACGREVAAEVWERLGVGDVEGLRQLLLARGRERLLAHLADT